MNLQIVNPNEIQDWDSRILKFTDYSFFHSSEWAELINRTYKYSFKYYIYPHNGEYSVMLPMMIVKSILTGKRAVSLPFSDYCEPLVAKDINFKDVFDEIIKDSINNKLDYLEIRGGAEFFDDIEPSTYDYNHTLNLTPGEESLFKRFSSNTKRNIKKAVRENVKVEISNSSAAMEEFYKMNCITRQKHGLPPQPKKFFDNFYELILKKNLGFISLGKHNGKYVAGAVYLLIGYKAIYKYGASYMEYQNLRANNLVMWEAIKNCVSKGYKSFYFGRTEPDNEGLRRFKLGWGTEESKLNTYRYDLKKRNFVPVRTKTSGIHNKIFNKAPLPLLKFFGSMIYRHFG